MNFATNEICKRCKSYIISASFVAENANISVTASSDVSSKTNQVSQESILENAGFRRIILGVISIIGGVGLSYVNFNGNYYVFYGAVLFGVINTLKGVIGLFD
jgi:hypothetical protein